MNLNNYLNELKSDKNIKVLFGTFRKENKIEPEFEKIIDYYYNRPLEFASDLIYFNGDNRQKEIMESIRDYKRTTVRSGQGIGKTATVACIVVWYLCTRYNAKIIATAPNITQLHTVLWAEIAKWLQNSPLKNYLTQTKTRLYMNGYENTWFAFPKTATTQEGIAGQHADNLLVIADEASGIRDEILETLLGTITGAENRLLFISNPTRTSGTYYDSFHRNRAKFNCIHVNAENCERVDKENLEMLACSYGIESNIYKVRAQGEFPTQEDDVFLSLHKIEAAINRDLDEKREIVAIKIGVDIARFGDDDTVIAINIAGQIKPFIEKHGNDTTETTGNVIKAAKEVRANLGQSHHVIVVVDDTGVGGGVTDQLVLQKKEQGLDWLYIFPVNAAEAIRHEYYQDITTYLWAIVRDLLTSQELSLPNNQDMVGQLSVRKYNIRPNGKIQLESKKEMKKRGIKSPDIADALVLSCYPINYERLFNHGRRKRTSNVKE